MMHYTVTVTDWTQPRGYRGSGRGWRVRCFGLPDDDFNALGRTVSEQFFRSQSAAVKAAKDLARRYSATLSLPE
jgi:hypothetical protein